MKYNQPWGISDPNGPYINGDPSTGIAGSIPPAASIEYPQREIVNLIADVNLATPDNADLHQLSKAVQSMMLISDDDAGTANNLQVTMTPNPGVYYKYLTVVCKIANDNTDKVVLNCNALGPKQVRHTDASQLAGGELKAGMIACFIYDGVNFQYVWSSSVGGTGGAIYLSAPRDFYVNGTTGSDTNDGTAATVGGGHGPYLTIQKAANQLALYNLNGYNVTIHVADGTYTSASFPIVNGSGQVKLIGNTTTPASCAVAPPAGLGNCALSFNIGTFFVTGFRLSAALSQNNDCIAASGGGSVVVIGGKMQFGAAGRAHLYAQSAASVSYDTVATTNVTLESGASAASHIYCQISSFGSVSVPAGAGGYPNLTIVGGLTFSGGFIHCLAGSYTAVTYASISGAAAVAGPRYNAEMNGVIQSLGGGASYYPGNSAGLIATGGQYV